MRLEMPIRKPVDANLTSVQTLYNMSSESGSTKEARYCLWGFTFECSHAHLDALPEAFEMMWRRVNSDLGVLTVHIGSYCI